MQEERGFHKQQKKKSMENVALSLSEYRFRQREHYVSVLKTKCFKVRNEVFQAMK